MSPYIVQLTLPPLDESKRCASFYDLQTRSFRDEKLTTAEDFKLGNCLTQLVQRCTVEIGPSTKDRAQWSNSSQVLDTFVSVVLIGLKLYSYRRDSSCRRCL